MYIELAEIYQLETPEQARAFASMLSAARKQEELNEIVISRSSTVVIVTGPNRDENDLGHYALEMAAVRSGFTYTRFIRAPK